MICYIGLVALFRADECGSSGIRTRSAERNPVAGEYVQNNRQIAPELIQPRCSDKWQILRQARIYGRVEYVMPGAL